MKRCCHCRRRKPIAQFHRNRCTVDGLAKLCRKCARQERALRYRRHPERHKASARKWVVNNRQKQRAIHQRWHQTPKGKEHLRKWGRINRARLVDSVIRGDLKARKIPITHENIERHRAQIRAKRAGRFFRVIAAGATING